MRTYHLLGIILLGIISFTSCEEKKNRKEATETTAHETIEPSHKKEGKHWSYEGETAPEYWAELGENDCGGKSQSPINIITTEVTKDSKEQFNLKNFYYSPKTKIHSVVNNGHSIQYNFDEGDYLDYNGEKYKLAQFHFHSPSEHLINGMRYPLEIHMVHATDDKKILVLSFLVKEGNQSEAFTELESFLPIDKGQKKETDFSYDFLDHIKKDFKYYHYKGSLTTPPCTEGVDWFIMQEPIVLSEKQVELMHQSMANDNYRPVKNVMNE